MIGANTAEEPSVPPKSAIAVRNCHNDSAWAERIRPAGSATLPINRGSKMP